MKRISFLMSFLAMSLFFTQAASAQAAPNFAPAQYIQSNGQPMLGDNVYTAADVCDWNADGKKDLLIGVFYNGNIWAFINQGTDSDPLFGPGVELQADGSVISVAYG